MVTTLKDALIELAIGIQDLGLAIAELKSRAEQIIPDAEKITILLALPSLKTDLRDAEAQFAALAAQQVEFQPPTDADFDALKRAAERLSAANARMQASSTLVNAATALVAAMDVVSKGRQA